MEVALAKKLTGDLELDPLDLVSRNVLRRFSPDVGPIVTSGEANLPCLVIDAIHDGTASRPPGEPSEVLTFLMGQPFVSPSDEGPSILGGQRPSLHIGEEI